MAYWIVFYDFVDDYVERRVPLRAEHLALVSAAHDRGELLLGGALADPVEGAVIVFTVDDPAVIETFVAADPYVRAGIVTGWRLRPWSVVIGPGVEPPEL